MDVSFNLAADLDRLLKSAAVAAGSVHPTGGRYEWAPDSPPLPEMPDLPPKLLEMARMLTSAHESVVTTTAVCVPSVPLSSNCCDGPARFPA